MTSRTVRVASLWVAKSGVSGVLHVIARHIKAMFEDRYGHLGLTELLCVDLEAVRVGRAGFAICIARCKYAVTSRDFDYKGALGICCAGQRNPIHLLRLLCLISF